MDTREQCRRSILTETQSRYPVVYVLLSAVSGLTILTVVQQFARGAAKLDVSTILLVVCVSLVLSLSGWFLERRKVPLSLLLLAIPAAIVFSGRGEALVAVALFFFGTVSVGLRIVEFSRWTARPFQVGLLALGLGMGVNAFLVWAMMHVPINTTAVYFALYVAEIAVGWTCLRKWGKEAFHSLSNLHPTLAQMLLFLWASVVMLYALVPGFNYDELAVHLYVPHVVSLYRKFDFDPRYSLALDIAIIPRSIYTSLYLLGGEFAVRLSNWGLVVLSLFGVEQFAYERLRPLPALFVTMSTALTPFLLWSTAYIFIDSFSLFFTFLVILCLLRVCETNSTRQVILFVVLLFFAFIGKQQSLFVVVPAFLFFLGFRLVRSKELPLGVAAKGIMVGGAATLIALTILLVHNWVLSGNPVLPYFNSLFRSRYFAPYSMFRVFPLPLRWDSLYQLTFHGSRYIQIDDFALGIGFFCFLPA